MSNVALWGINNPCFVHLDPTNGYRDKQYKIMLEKHEVYITVYRSNSTEKNTTLAV